MKVRRPKTSCGLYGNRAKVISRDGDRLTFRWPCGYEKSEVFMIGRGRLRVPAGSFNMKFFFQYWSDGVSYECPKCRRVALKIERLSDGEV